ncbi:uncharacterized protein IAS62_005682 [Cryptococcus decagattii]|uniref:Uncharacterized protein n=1 Tax=Cryptococcus decagattii TaxID=1859122 RepID=A0ABZ2B4F0_9TREE
MKWQDTINLCFVLIRLLRIIIPLLHISDLCLSSMNRVYNINVPEPSLPPIRKPMPGLCRVDWSPTTQRVG